MEMMSGKEDKWQYPILNKGNRVYKKFGVSVKIQ